MAITTALINYRRFLKRRNYSGHTLKHYMNTLKHFILWLDVRLEAVDHKKLLAYIDYLLDRGLQPKTINCHLDSIRGFYHYLIEEEQVQMVNPVKRGYALRLSRPLPRHLRDEEVVQALRGDRKPAGPGYVYADAALRAAGRGSGQVKVAGGGLASTPAFYLPGEGR